jgi:hypothetical protein
MGRAANEFWTRLQAAVVHKNNFERRRIRLPRQGLQTLIERYPIVINRDDNAESR